MACLPFVLLAATFIGKDVELRSVGAYPDMPAAVGWALRRVVRRSRHVSARDIASVQALGGLDHVTLVRDPAWELAPAAPDVVSAVLNDAGAREDRPTVAVSLKPGAGEHTDRRCVAAVAEGLDYWVAEHDGQILFLSFSDKGDYALGADLTDLDLGRTLQRSMAQGERVHFVGPGLHPAVMRGVVGRCSGVVAMRLHAQIFGMAAERPVYGLSFEVKCDEFLGSVGIRPVRPDAVSADDLGRWLDGLAERHPTG